MPRRRGRRLRVDEIEETLTDGYAQALALEAERLAASSGRDAPSVAVDARREAPS